MKILWFTNTQISSKTVGESWVQALMMYLSKRENVTLAIASMSNSKTIEKETVADNIKIFKLPRNSGIRKGFLNLRFQYYFDNDKATKDYLEVISQFNPDIIQIFGSENNFGLIIPKINIPVVIHIQGILTVYLEKYFSGISRQDINKTTTFKQKINRSSLINYFNFFRKRANIEEKILKNAEFVFGRTMWDRRTTRVLSPSAKYLRCEEVIRNDFFENNWNLTNNSTPKLITVLRNNPYKGMDTIVKTSKLLKSLNFNFSWEIIGALENDQVNNILKKIYSVNFESINIKFKGNKSGKEMVELMLSSDIFIQPSHIENSPNSVCEAMVLGMPIITTYAGGTVDLLKNDEEGLLIQDGDPYVLAGAIMELSENDDLKIKFSNNARIRAKDRHNPEKITDDLLENYKTIISTYQDEQK